MPTASDGGDVLSLEPDDLTALVEVFALLVQWDEEAKGYRERCASGRSSRGRARTCVYEPVAANPAA